MPEPPRWALHPSHPSVHFPEDLLLSLARKSSSLTEWGSASAHFRCSPGSVSLGPHSQPALSLFSLQDKLVRSGPEETKRTQAHEQHLKSPGTVGYRLCRALLPSLWQTALLGYGEGVGWMPQDSRPDSRSLVFKCFA